MYQKYWTHLRETGILYLLLSMTKSITSNKQYLHIVQLPSYSQESSSLDRHKYPYK